MSFIVSSVFDRPDHRSLSGPETLQAKGTNRCVAEKSEGKFDTEGLI